MQKSGFTAFSLSLYQYLQCLYVMKEEEIVGVAGLHVLGGSCRSTIFSRFAYICRKRIGRMLVNHIINEAAKIKVSRVISLTYETEFSKVRFVL